MKNYATANIVNEQLMTEEEFVQAFLTLRLEERAAFIDEMQRRG